MEPHGRTALVTGATKGIGRAIALDLAAHHVKVLLNYRQDDERAKQTLSEAQDLRPDCELLQGDVADSADVDQIFRRIRTEHGRLDMFVSNAGVTADGFALMMGEQKWRQVIDTNLTGAFLCCRAAGRIMGGQRAGAIVVVGSASGLAAPAGQANYAASKAGLLSLVGVLAKELGGYGVRVNAVVPGFVDTAMTRGMPRDQLDTHLDNIPLGRIGQPEEVAPAVRFLLSEEARYITGAAVAVDGGLTC
jgi:3-oxoacyl-[acyl-carrier protein] reductase